MVTAGTQGCSSIQDLHTTQRKEPLPLVTGSNTCMVCAEGGRRSEPVRHGRVSMPLP